MVIWPMKTLMWKSRVTTKNDLAKKHHKFFSSFGEVTWLLLITRPFPRDEGMVEDHGAPQAGKLPRVWTRGRTETESRQRVSGAKSP